MGNNNTKPKVSVLMSVYNESLAWVKDSIESILNQSFKDFEFIIVNDNPNRKDIEKLINDYKNQNNRIKILKNKINLGLTKSLNLGLEIAKGDYIARMDADDISLPKRLEKQFKFLEENKEYIVCGTDFTYFGDVVSDKKNDFIFFSDKEIREYLLLNSCFAHPSVMFRKSILLENKIKYDEDFVQAQDYKLWYDLYEYGMYMNINEVLLKYRVNEGQVTKKFGKSQSVNGSKIRGLFLKKYLPSEIIEKLLLNEVNGIKTLKAIKKILKSKKVSNQEYKNIIFLIYLSIKKNTIMLLVNYFISLDFLLFVNKPLDILRIIESCVFPKRKVKRIL